MRFHDRYTQGDFYGVEYQSTDIPQGTRGLYLHFRGEAIGDAEPLLRMEEGQISRGTLFHVRIEAQGRILFDTTLKNLCDMQMAIGRHEGSPETVGPGENYDLGTVFPLDTITHQPVGPDVRMELVAGKETSEFNDWTLNINTIR